MDRRNFLKIAGITSGILAASAAGFVFTRQPAGALIPWEEAGKADHGPMLAALSYALLAPNPHNRQPWIVELSSDRTAMLYCDLDRQLPATDPFSRQITIGLGCFLENLAVAATFLGHHADINLFPSGMPGDQLDSRPIAQITLEKDPGMEQDPLFKAILTRRTNRQPYDLERPVAPAQLKRLTEAPGGVAFTSGTVEGAMLDRLRKLTRDAMLVEMHTKPAHQESVDLMRIGRSEIEANPDGISLGGPMLEAMNAVGMLTRETLADPDSTAFKTGLDMIEKGAMTAMGFAWITTESNNRLDQIEAGRAYMRLSLQAALEGLSLQPMSQALQEYPEMKTLYHQVHELLAPDSGDTVQMLARLGYADRPAPSPRWPLETFIRKG